MNARVLFIVCGVAAAVLFAVVAFRKPAAEPAAPAMPSAVLAEAAEPGRPKWPGQSEPATVKASQRAAWVAPASASSPKAVSPPLPPLKTPLAEILDELRERARKGDAMAACRLAAEMERCRVLPSYRQLAESARARREKEPPQSDRRQRESESARFWEDAVRQDEPVCAGIDPADTTDGWRYLLQAAQSGHVASMVSFAGGWSLLVERSPGETLDGWIALRDNGLAYIQAGIDAGYAPAFELGRFVYWRGDNHGIPVPKDPVRSVAYSLALARVSAPVEQLRSQANADYVIRSASLSAADVARAHAMAEPLASKLLSRSNQGSIDFTRGTYGIIDRASLCEMDK